MSSSVVVEGRRPGGRWFGPAAALMVVLGLGACAVAEPAGPVVGRWQGEQDGPVITDLTLHGRLQDGSGRYDISTLVHNTGSLGSQYTPWSGRWVRATEEVGGDERTVIRLQGALNDEIDRYVLDSAGILEPTSDTVHRPLTREEVSLYSLYPVGRD
jgi:hypothetical protein